MQPRSRSPMSILGDMFVAFVVIMLATGLGFVLGLTVYASGLRMLLSVFIGPAFLFFVLAGLGLGYVVNRQLRSDAAPLMWILPAIWSAIRLPLNSTPASTRGKVCRPTFGTP